MTRTRNFIDLRSFRTVEEYSASELALIEQGMRRPQEFYPQHILGPFLESSESIIAVSIEDLLTMAKYGAEISDLVRELNNCMAGFKEIMRLQENDGVEPTFERQSKGYGIAPGILVKSQPAMGQVKCPFTDPRDHNPDNIFPLRTYEVVNRKKDGTFKFTELGAHLIGQHHFFGGRGSYTRVDPWEAIDFFDLLENRSRQ